MKFLPILLLIALATISRSNAEEAAVPVDDLPPAPPSHILDRARIFKPDQHSELSRRLLTLEHQQDISLYIAAYTFLTNESIDERAVRLKNHWVNATNGVVIVYVRSTSQISFAASDQFQNALSATDLMDIFTSAAAKARETSAPNPSHHQLVTTACTFLTDTLVARVGRKIESKTEERSYMRIFTISFGAVLILLSISGFAFNRFQTKRRARITITHYFPDIVVGQRFGAQHGGGSLAEISFRER